jgi:hypothetical protein
MLSGKLLASLALEADRLIVQVQGVLTKGRVLEPKSNVWFLCAPDLAVAVVRRNEQLGFDLVEVNPMVEQAKLVVELLARAVEHASYRRHHPRRTEESGTA